MFEKRIVLFHKPKLLEDFKALHKPEPESYKGFVYIWHCVPEDMYYIGSHKGKTYDDYRGSGVRFRQALETHGLPKFNRSILEYVDDETLIKNREQHWMNVFNAAKSQFFYNIRNTRK